MLRLRSTVFMVLFYLVFAGFLLAMLPTLALRRDAIFFMGRAWGRTNLWMLRAICGVGVEFRGLDNIPEDTGVIVAAKHQAAWDTFALLTKFSDFVFVMKGELLRIPLFGWYMRRAGQIGINRSKGADALRDIVVRAREVLAAGRPLFIFPEGTRRPPGAAPSYKPGIARIYAECRAPCLPVALNSGLFWPRKSWLRPPGTVLVEFLAPIEPGLPRAQFMRELQRRIETASDRLTAEAVDADPSLRASTASGAPAASQGGSTDASGPSSRLRMRTR